MLRPTLISVCSLLALTTTLAAADANPWPGIQGEIDASLTGRGGSDGVAMTWYPGWHWQDFPPEKLSWSKYTAIAYAFATTTPDPSVLFLNDSDVKLLPTFVKLANDHDVDALLSIGGWTGSQHFSTAVGTPANRTKFVKAVVDLVQKYKLDGVEFDWEFPTEAGAGCNDLSKNDTANFLSFLQELRKDPVMQTISVSAAVTLTTFADEDGKPMADVSAFSYVLDQIHLMDYDVWGSWSTGVGPNAPLNDSCASSADQQGSAISGVKAWTSAGFPVNRIVLGVAGYGHSFHVNVSSAVSSDALVSYPPFDKSLQPSGDKWDDPAGIDQCGNYLPVGGIFNFWGMIKDGFLNKKGKAEKGILYRYDKCSETPYVYNPETQVMISYDDATSFAAKGKFIKDVGLGGFAMWEAGSDYNDILLDSISKAIDIKPSY